MYLYLHWCQENVCMRTESWVMYTSGKVYILKWLKNFESYASLWNNRRNGAQKNLAWPYCMDYFMKTACFQTRKKWTISNSIYLTEFVLGYLDTGPLPKVSVKQNQSWVGRDWGTRSIKFTLWWNALTGGSSLLLWTLSISLVMPADWYSLLVSLALLEIILVDGDLCFGLGPRLRLHKMPRQEE